MSYKKGDIVKIKSSDVSEVYVILHEYFLADNMIYYSLISTNDFANNVWHRKTLKIENRDLLELV